MSTWQQAGRVGRRADQEALIILVAGDDALDQYYATHPARLFAARSERAAVDPSNPQLLVGHLLCAAAEAPLAAPSLRFFPDDAPRVVGNLERDGVLSHGQPRTAPGTLYNRVAIRGVRQDATYTLFEGNRKIGTLEQPYLQREAYPGAVYLHNGVRYQVTAWDRAQQHVYVEREQNDVRRTDALTDVQVKPVGSALASRTVSVRGCPFVVTLGSVRAAETMASYRELSRPGARWADVLLPEPLEFTIDTIGIWVDIPADLRAADAHLHALEHALVNVVPLHLLTDRRDLGSTSSPQDSPGGRVTLFDRCEGGAGLCEHAFQDGVLEALFDEAAQLLRGCPCADGCPSCIHLAGCGRGNDQLDKSGALALLEGRPAATPNTPAPRRPPLRVSEARADLTDAELDHRVRQIVADEQRRRIQSSPDLPPVEVGGRVATPLGRATVLEVVGDRIKVRYEGFTTWSWVARKDLKRR